MASDAKSNVRDVFKLENNEFRTELLDLSNNIWKNPEIGFREYKAHDLLTAFLEKYGLKVERKYKLETAFKATFGDDDDAKKGPHVAIICEYDALPGIGHACGHNLIAEIGVAAGIAVKKAMESNGCKLKGKLTVLGTPAEEGLGGKVQLIDAGVLDDVDVAMMAHPSNKTIWRPKYLCVQGINMQYTGKASHASSAPWYGINALDAAVLCYQNISCLRHQMKPTWRVHGIIKNGGMAPNIIPEFTEMEYFIRAPTKGELDIIVDKVIACANGAATATGCILDYKLVQPGYWSLLSNDTLANLFETNAQTVGIEPDPGLVRYGGSTDMGNVSHIIPSIHPKFNIGTTSHQHTRDFAATAGNSSAQCITLKIAESIAMTAIDIFQNPSLLATMKTQLKEDLIQEHAAK